MTDLNKVDKDLAKQAGGLAFDIIRNELHFPIKDGKINVERIEDEIIIGMYSGELLPISDEVVELAIGVVQDMVDQFEKDKDGN